MQQSQIVEQQPTAFDRFLIRLRSIFCRHTNSVIETEGRNVHMFCPDCRHKSPGWEIEGRPRQRFS